MNDKEKVAYKEVERMMEKPTPIYMHKDLNKRVNWLMIITALNAINTFLIVFER